LSYHEIIIRPEPGRKNSSMTPSQHYRDKVVLITGAASGVGRQLALTLSARGARIAAVDLSPDPLAKLQDDLAGQPIVWAIADVTDRPGIIAAVSDLERRLGSIDIMIANAGIGRGTDPFNFKAESVEAEVRVNLIGVANTIEAVLPGMLERKRGQLVAIASLASYRGLPKLGGYCASKAGVTALMDSLRYDLRPVGIDVTTICPGWINTALIKDLEGPHHFMMPVEEAVNRMVWAIEKRKPWDSFPSSSARRVRWLRWLPCFLSDWVLRKMMPMPKLKKTEPQTGR
jgi:NAD(P)-dependent dehydrogenase (short-subunit alcohol dehydrogenase family)